MHWNDKAILYLKEGYDDGDILQKPFANCGILLNWDPMPNLYQDASGKPSRTAKEYTKCITYVSAMIIFKWFMMIIGSVMVAGNKYYSE